MPEGRPETNTSQRRNIHPSPFWECRRERPRSCSLVWILTLIQEDSGQLSQTQLITTVILRKRRPSQSEGLPTKDLCTRCPPAKCQQLSSRASEGSAVLSTGKPRVPHISRFSRCGCRKISHTPLQTHCHPEEAQTFATRRPAKKDLCILSASPTSSRGHSKFWI